MQAKLAPISRVFYIIIIGAVIYFLAKLAYGWSLNETARFATAVVGDQYAQAASWAIQLAPQALLVITAFVSIKNEEYARLVKAAVYVAIFINLFDVGTNIGAYLIWLDDPNVQTYQATLHPIVQEMAYYFGFILAFAVTWFEEVIMLLVAVGLTVIAETARDFDIDVPDWFRLDAQALANRASGISAVKEAVNKKKRPTAANTTTRRRSRIRQRPPAPHGNTMREPSGWTTTVTPTSERE